MLVKICGLTRPQDAVAAARAGADLLGFVFAPSPRRVSMERALFIAATVRGLAAGATGGNAPRPLLVGVFVDENAEVVAEVMQAIGLDLAQLHGGENVEFCRRFGHRAIKSFRVGEEFNVELLRPYLGVARSFLLDAYDPVAAGGSGRSFHWELARGMGDLGASWFLAGGLNPDNVEEAIRQCRPAGVDVSSGVESAPGIKDHDKMRAFITRAHGGAHA